MGNAVSVNNSFLQACTPGTHGGKRFDCPLGRTLLGSTGFDGNAVCGDPSDYPLNPQNRPVGGATGWLQTTARATGGSVMTLRFAIWDSGDPDLDSTTLVDGFAWELEEIENERPETEPIF